MAVYYSPFAYPAREKVVLLLCIPCASGFACFSFLGRVLSLGYLSFAGSAGSSIAIVPDFPFIVLRLMAWQYSGPDGYRYAIAMLVISVAAGIVIRQQETVAEDTNHISGTGSFRIRHRFSFGD